LAAFYKNILPADIKGLLYTPHKGIFRGCANDTEYELLVQFREGLFEVRYLSFITKDYKLGK
jgi:hypothetical protein